MPSPSFPLPLHDIHSPASPLELCHYPPFLRGGVRVWLKRDDRIEGPLSGNKFRKLQFNLLEASSRGYRKLLTPGGAWSNHLLAVSTAGREFGFETTALVRGERPVHPSPILQQCRKNGMALQWLSRMEYRNRSNPAAVSRWISRNGPGTYWIPEGGTNRLALPGVARLVGEIAIPFDYLCLPCGTGGTMAGCLSAIGRQALVIGFPALRGGEFLYHDIASLLEISGTRLPRTSWTLETRFHFGGYAKFHPELLEFVEEFEGSTGIRPEPVYTAKALFGLRQLIRERHFPPGSEIVYLMTQSHSQPDLNGR